MRVKKPKPKNDVIAPVQTSYRTSDYDITNVNPTSVASILRAVRYGRIEDQDRLFRLMIDSWPHLRKCLNEIAGAVASLELNIIAPIMPGEIEPSPRATEIAATVRKALNLYSPDPAAWELGMDGMIKALVDAYAKGFSVMEIVFDYTDGVVHPRCYCPVPASFLSYPTSSNEVERMMLCPSGSARSGGTLTDFPEDKFLVGIWHQGGAHPIHCANLRALTKHWQAAVFGLGWLMQYAQLFGIPFRTAKTDGSEEAMAKAEELMANIGASGWAVTAGGLELEIHSPAGGSAADLPQALMIEVADKACSTLMLGQTLTSDSGQQGSRALGVVHSGIRKEVLQGVADWVAGIITDQLIPAIVRANYGNVGVNDMPYAQLDIPVPRDEITTAQRIKLCQEMGLPMTREWVYASLGIPMPEPGQDLFIRMEDSTIEEPEDPEDSIEDDLSTDNSSTDPTRSRPGPDDVSDGQEPPPPVRRMARAAIAAHNGRKFWQRGLSTPALVLAHQIANESLTRSQVMTLISMLEDPDTTKRDRDALGGNEALVWAMDTMDSWQASATN